ncbi:MAG: 5-formyltetrahydrofolate cyclo-ligase [Lachnospiraceae bacterium]|nr:5-formyltetrahydrofolate cyclo-ligase [Lachnospiraceae bacterium]
MDLQLSKKELRREFMAKRKALAAAEWEKISAWMTDRLFTLPAFADADSVFCFFGMAHEPDTKKILCEVLRRGKHLAMPRIEGKGLMTAREVTDLSSLRPGSFGIPEPSEEAPVVPAGELSLILVPGLAFTEAGFRLGHGGGFYDRYLPETQCPAIGLCPEQFITDELPIGAYDVRIPFVLTESRLIITGEYI